MDFKKTRQSHRAKKFSSNIKFVDSEIRNLVYQQRIDELES